MATLSVSALRRFSAISNDVRVRVLGSKNRLTTVRPRSVGTFLIGALADFLHRVGGVEDQHDLLGAEIGDAEQVLAAERGERLRRRLNGFHDHASSRSMRTSSSSTPSSSCRRTCTLSWRDVGTFLPT